MGLHDTPIYKKDGNDTAFTSGKAILVVSMSVFNVLMLLGNTVSIVTITTSPSLRKQVSYWFVLNLAVIDMLITVTVVPLNTMWEYYGTWPLGGHACKFITFADNSFSTVSAYSIALVSIDKYLYITYAVHYHDYVTKRVALILITGVWISVSVFSSVSIFGGFSSAYFEEEITNACIFVMKDTHAIIAAILSFFIPLAILCFTTARIISIANRHIKRIHATPSFTYTEVVSDESTCTSARNSFTKVTSNPNAKRKSFSVFQSSNDTGIIFNISGISSKMSEAASSNLPSACQTEPALMPSSRTEPTITSQGNQPRITQYATELTSHGTEPTTLHETEPTTTSHGTDQTITSLGIEWTISYVTEPTITPPRTEPTIRLHDTEPKPTTTQRIEPTDLSIGLSKQLNPIEPRNAKIVSNFGLSNCDRVNQSLEKQRRLANFTSCPTLRKTFSSSNCKSKSQHHCKLFGTVTIVIAFFIFMFSPFYIALMIDVGCHCISPWIYEDILAVLCHTHALVNPYIYILTDKKYKQAFKHLWKKRCKICHGWICNN